MAARSVNGYSRDIGTIARRYGPDKAAKLGAMSLEGGHIIRERVAKYNLACDLRQGGFFAAFTEKQIREMEAHKATWEKARPHRLADGVEGGSPPLCEVRPLCRWHDRYAWAAISTR